MNGSTLHLTNWVDGPALSLTAVLQHSRHGHHLGDWGARTEQACPVTSGFKSSCLCRHSVPKAVSTLTFPFSPSHPIYPLFSSWQWALTSFNFLIFAGFLGTILMFCINFNDQIIGTGSFCFWLRRQEIGSHTHLKQQAHYHLFLSSLFYSFKCYIQGLGS